MSWTAIIKDMDRESSEEDIANAISELEQLQEVIKSGQSIEVYNAYEMKQLRDALGKVSTLLLNYKRQE